MKIKMLEHFKGRGQPSLSPGTEHDSAAIGEELAAWLVEHGKAVDVTPKPKPTPRAKPAAKKTSPKKPAARARKSRGSVKDEGS